MSEHYTVDQLIAKLASDDIVPMEEQSHYYRLPMWLRDALLLHLRLARPEAGVDSKALLADLYTMETNLLMGNIGQAREIIERIRTSLQPQREEVK